jgi:hypothetical protein
VLKVSVVGHIDICTDTSIYSTIMDLWWSAILCSRYREGLGVVDHINADRCTVAAFCDQFDDSILC